MIVPASAAMTGGDDGLAISNAMWYEAGYWVITPFVGQMKVEDPLTPDTT